MNLDIEKMLDAEIFKISAFTRGEYTGYPYERKEVPVNDYLPKITLGKIVSTSPGIGLCEDPWDPSPLHGLVIKLYTRTLGDIVLRFTTMNAYSKKTKDRHSCWEAGCVIYLKIKTRAADLTEQQLSSVNCCSGKDPNGKWSELVRYPFDYVQFNEEDNKLNIKREVFHYPFNEYPNVKLFSSSYQGEDSLDVDNSLFPKFRTWAIKYLAQAQQEKKIF